MYLVSERIVEHRSKLCSESHREYDFKVVFGYVVNCRKRRSIYRHHSSNVVGEVEMPAKSMFLVTILSCDRTFSSRRIS